MTEDDHSHNYLFAICITCGRFAEGNEATPEESTLALTEWAADHRGVQQFGEKPEGWPFHVKGVRTNDHLKVTLSGADCCVTCGPGWPCAPYVEHARQCPGNGLGLLPEGQETPGA